MSSLSFVAGMFAAEMRCLWRRAALWSCATLAFGAGVAAYLRFTFVHYPVYGYGPTHAAVDPRFLVSGFGTCILAVLLVGTVFMAFDGRARDERERIAEVLDSKPISNVRLLTGRLAGLVLTMWLALVLVLTALAPSAAGVAMVFGLPVGSVRGWVEPTSLIAFAVVDALPALTFWGATVVLLAATLRSRLLTASVAFLLLGMQFFWLLHTPLYLLPVLSTVGDVSAIGSDVLPQFADGRALAQRGCLLLLAAGFLALAAAAYPRRDASRVRLPAIGLTLTVLGLSGAFALIVDAVYAMNERDQWATLHAEKRNAHRADVKHYEARLVIEPGRRLALQVDVHLELADEQAPGTLALSFNPGLVVDDLTVGGQPAPHGHADGVLTVQLPRAPAGEADLILSLSAEGVPDARFAYLDSTRDAMTTTLANSLLHVLGTEGSIFHSRYVALMPGVRWLPMPGANFAGDGPSGLGRDLFTLDLQVQVPRGWLVAGPGRAVEVEGNGSERFRFRPRSPLPEVAIIAARFERRAMEVAGIEFELLAHPKHLGNVELFANASDELAAQMEFAFSFAARAGLPYPYDSLTVVETPGALRSYDGGWRSVQSLPGILLLREYGFPTASFPPRIRDQSGGEQIGELRYYFDGDFGGGDPLVGVLRNFLHFQTAADSRAMDFLLERMATQTLGLYFNVQQDRSAPHLFELDGADASVLGWAMASPAAIHRKVRNEPSRPSVRELAESVPLGTLARDQRRTEALAAMTRKGGTVARAIVDELGVDASFDLLAALRRRHVGRRFNAADVERIAHELGLPSPGLVGDWLGQSSLPGFLISPVEVFRLADDEQGSPRYQTRLHVRNDEPTPGLVRVLHRSTRFAATDPIRVPGFTSVQIGILSTGPPVSLSLDPYLALNRTMVFLDVPSFDAAATVDVAPFAGVRPSAWRPRQGRTGRPRIEIVVDDLDAGFVIEGDGRGESTWRSWLNFRDQQDGELDRGLPVYADSVPVPAGRWHRRTDQGWGWGKYRRTVAMATRGDGGEKAVFSAELPLGGRWRLEYHLPSRIRHPPAGNRLRTLYGAQGRYDLRLEWGGVRGVQGVQRAPVEVDFDASIAAPGWVHLGDFALPPGNVRLVVSNRTDGEVVIADAIRWRPVRQ